MNEEHGDGFVVKDRFEEIGRLFDRADGRRRLLVHHERRGAVTRL